MNGLHRFYVKWDEARAAMDFFPPGSSKKGKVSHISLGITWQALSISRAKEGSQVTLGESPGVSLCD